MNQHDEKLRNLLRQWPGIEPKANFEADVWRRIRRAGSAQPERIGLIDLIQQWLWRPALAVTTAAIVSLAIGISGGLLAASRTAPVHNEMTFMSAGTLSGGYVHLAGERGR